MRKYLPTLIKISDLHFICIVLVNSTEALYIDSFISLHILPIQPLYNAYLYDTRPSFFIKSSLCFV